MKGSENRVFRFAVEKNVMDGIFRGPFKLISVVSGENAGGVNASVEPPGTYSRRFPEEMIGIIRPRCSLRPKVSAIEIKGTSMLRGTLVTAGVVEKPATGFFE